MAEKIDQVRRSVTSQIAKYEAAVALRANARDSVVSSVQNIGVIGGVGYEPNRAIGIEGPAVIWALVTMGAAPLSNAHKVAPRWLHRLKIVSTSPFFARVRITAWVPIWRTT